MMRLSVIVLLWLLAAGAAMADQTQDDQAICRASKEMGEYAIRSLTAGALMISAMKGQASAYDESASEKALGQFSESQDTIIRHLLAQMKSIRSLCKS